MISRCLVTVIVIGVVVLGLVVLLYFTQRRSNFQTKPPSKVPLCNAVSKEDTHPKIVAFREYLRKNMQSAVNGVAKEFNYTPDTQIGLAIYMKNTPLGRGPIREWVTACGNNDCQRPKKEPSFYFGSGTKPVTATLVASKLYKLWRSLYPHKKPSEFIEWYAGRKNAYGLRGGVDAVSFKDLFTLTKGFAKSQFTESLSTKSNTQAADSSDKTYTQTLQEWLFCCPTEGLMRNCPAGTSLFCDNSCDKICPIPLDSTSFSNKCTPPLCPDDLCSWAWCEPKGVYTSSRNRQGYAKPTCTGSKVNPKDPNGSPWLKGVEWCSCPVVLPRDYAHILNNLSIYNIAMMRAAIPDSDSIWGVDTAAQLASRTNPIGPIQFVAEILGFDWNPLWSEQGPLVSSMDADYSEDTINPAAMYSSSAYTFLGILLWLLTDSGGRRDWSTIDLNAMLPKELYCLINFAGTEGRHNKKYFRTDAYGNKYYSYEQTVSKGGVAHSPDVVGKDGNSTTIIGHNQTTLERIVKESFRIRNKKARISALALSTAAQRTQRRGGLMDEGTLKPLKWAPVYPREMRTLKGSHIVDFVDWDASSGVMDGNAWGPCSGMAEMYMNIFSPTAENPIMPKEIQATYVQEFLSYSGPNWKALYNNKLRAPFCLGGQAWGQGSTYNCGAMGPDWFYITSGDPGPYYSKPGWKNGTIGVIPCYGHLGETYGSCSGHVYFPGGTLKAYPPLKSDNYAYVNKNKAEKWSLRFEFAGGLEFTISQASTNCQDQITAIQNFINLVIKNPFDWNQEE